MNNKKRLLAGISLFALGVAGLASISEATAVSAEDLTCTTENTTVKTAPVWGSSGDPIGISVDGVNDLGTWGVPNTNHTTTTISGDVPVLYDEYGVGLSIDGSSTPVNYFAYNDMWAIRYNQPNERYGNILHIPAGFTITTTGYHVGTYVFEEQWWINKMPDGETGDWEIFHAPTTVEFTSETYELTLGSDIDLDTLINIESEDENPVIVYKVDGTAATADENGMLTGTALGAVTVTAYSGLKTDTITINIVEGTAAQTGIELNLESVEAYQYLTADISGLKYAPVFEDGSKGALVAVPATAIAAFDTEEVGTKEITVTIDGFTATFDLVVKEMEEELEFVRPITGNYSLANAWGRSFAIGIVGNKTSNYADVSAEAAANIKRFVLVNDGKVDYSNVAMLKDSLSFKLVGKTGWVAGDVITLKAGLYSWDNGATGSLSVYEPVAVLKEDVHLFYNGTQFVESVGGIEDFDVVYPYTAIQIGETLNPSYEFTPNTTGERPTFVSSDPEVLAVTETGAVTGLKEGTATITATVGEISKNYEFTVVPVKNIIGVETDNSAYVHRIYTGQDLAEWNPTISDFILVYEDGTKSLPIPSDSFTYTVDKTFAHDQAGYTEATVNVTYKDVDYTCKLPIDVQDLRDQEIGDVAVVSGYNYWTAIDLETTSKNAANISDGSNLNQGDYITYTRADGTEVPLRTVWELQAAIYIEPSFIPTTGSGEKMDGENYNNSKYYLPGDILTIKTGLPVYIFNGVLSGQKMIEGEVVLEGYYKGEDRVYRFNGETWDYIKDPTGIYVPENEITLDVGKRVPTNVERLPADATTGEFTFESSDETVATVSNSGVISGVGPGECTITVTLTVNETTTYTAEIKVTVNDAITGVQVTNVDADNPLTVTKGSDLDLSKLEGTTVYASGKTGEDVDFSTARVVSGFDKNTVGDQIVTISITVDGKEYRLNINVRVVEEGTTPGGETSTPTESTPTGSTPTGETGEGGGLTPAAIGGIVGGCIGGVVVIGGIVWLVIWLRKKH